MKNVSSSNSQGELVPKLRFPGFEGEPYHPETVGTLFDHASRRNSDGSNGNVITNSAEHGLIPQRDFFDKDIAVEGNTSYYYIIKKGDFVYNPRKSTTAPYGPFNCYCLEDEGIVSPLYTCLTPKHEEFTEFLLWYFKSPAWYSYIYHNGAQGGARHDRVGMTNELMDGIPVNLPCLQEQEKISVLLSTLDRRIQTQQKLVDTLKSYKRGLLQRIFESKESVAGWQVIRLQEIFKKVSRRNKTGTVKNVITNSAEYGLVPQRDFFDKDIAVDGNTDNYYIIETGDFVYNPRKSKTAPYGPFNRYELEDRGIISPLYTCLVLTADINPSYLSWYFKSNAWHRYIYDNGSQGVRHDRVSMTDDLLMGIPVLIPEEAVQQKIAKTLDLLEGSIVETEKLFQALQDTKSALLREMFI